MRFIYVTDPHFQASYANRLDNVLDTFEDKVTQVFELAKEKTVDGIIWGGDIFNSKNPIRTPHWFIEWLIRLLRKSPCPMYSIVGNHDIQNNDLDTLYKQPLGVLFAAGVLTRLEHGRIKKLGDKVELVGYDFGTEFDELKDCPNKQPGWTRIVVVHTYLDSKPGEFYGERVWGTNELKHLKANVLLNGHDHNPYDMFVGGGATVMRPGGLFRCSRGNEDRTRPIQVGLIDTTDKDFKYVQLKYEKSDDIFDYESKDRVTTMNDELDQFVSNISTSMKFKKKSAIGELNKMDLPKDIQEKTLEYINLAKGESNDK